MAERTLSEQLAAFAADVAPGGLPPEVAASVRRRVLDILGVSLAALPLETSRAVADHAHEQGGVEQARAIGMPERLPAATAAFVNGVLAHSLDYDDTHLPSIVHPSASVIPASLAAAELKGASGGAFVAAVAAGLEICVRLGMAGYDRATRSSRYFDRGQHATSMCGALGSAAAAGKLLGLDAQGIGHALGIAASMASGILEGNRSGGTVKRLHCGMAAHAGVTAAALAGRGITAPPTALEGRFGFFQAFLDGRFDEAPITGGLGRTWEVPRISFKPYPSNHFTHAAIDAALALRARGVRADDVDGIHLGVAAATVRTIGEPIDAKRSPETGYQAQFSGPYAVAAALLGGSGLGLGLDDFTDDLARDPARRAIMARVTVGPDAECDAIYPEQLPAVVRLRLRDGTELEERVMTNRGGPARPLADEELARKFRDNAGRVLHEEAVAEIEQAVADLESRGDVSAMLAPTAAAYERGAA